MQTVQTNTKKASRIIVEQQQRDGNQAPRFDPEVGFGVSYGLLVFLFSLTCQ